MGNQWSVKLASYALLCIACVDGGDAGDAATQGSLGGPCFANNTCNSGLDCVLVNGKGVCEQADATADQTTSDEGGNDATQTTDVAGDVAPVDAGCEATVAAQPACLGNCSGQICCALSGQCYQSGCGVNCNGGGSCWGCTRGSDCSGMPCCATSATIQGTCPPTATIDPNQGAYCNSSCPNGLFLCGNNADCPTSAPTCVGANVSGIAHSTIGVCR